MWWQSCGLDLKMSMRRHLQGLASLADVVYKGRYDSLRAAAPRTGQGSPSGATPAVLQTCTC